MVGGVHWLAGVQKCLVVTILVVLTMLVMTGRIVARDCSGECDNFEGDAISQGEIDGGCEDTTASSYDSEIHLTQPHLIQQILEDRGLTNQTPWRLPLWFQSRWIEMSMGNHMTRQPWHYSQPAGRSIISQKLNFLEKLMQPVPMLCISVLGSHKT